MKQNKNKERAIALRLKGLTYPEIGRIIGLNRSSLSGWLSKLKLPQTAERRIQNRRHAHLERIRIKAAEYHRNEKRVRIEKISNQVADEVKSVKFNAMIQEMMLAALYLGEGFKRSGIVAMGNSNAKIMSAFVMLLRRLFRCDESKFRCYLYLRADQNPEKENHYWSKITAIPITQFGKPQFDRRTLGKKTFPDYHGVCAVYYFDANIEKRVTALQKILLEKMILGA